MREHKTRRHADNTEENCAQGQTTFDGKHKNDILPPARYVIVFCENLFVLKSRSVFQAIGWAVSPPPEVVVLHEL